MVTPKLNLNTSVASKVANMYICTYFMIYGIFMQLVRRKSPDSKIYYNVDFVVKMLKITEVMAM